jgi:hypothetical protein
MKQNIVFQYKLHMFGCGKLWKFESKKQHDVVKPSVHNGSLLLMKTVGAILTPLT